MNLLRTLPFALAAIGLRLLARGGTWAFDHVAAAAAWCDARARHEPRWPQGP